MIDGVRNVDRRQAGVGGRDGPTSCLRNTWSLTVRVRPATISDSGSIARRPTSERRATQTNLQTGANRLWQRTGAV